MSIIGWLSLGLFAGFVASKLSYETGREVLLELALGTVSAAVGGSFLYNVLGYAPVTSLDACSLIAAATGASTVLRINHALAQRRSP